MFAIRTPWKFLKVVQIEIMFKLKSHCFCARIDNLEQVSQVILACLLPPLSSICIRLFHSFQHCFYKRYISHFLICLLTLVFYCALIAANVRDFKGNCTIAGENLFLQKIIFSNFDELELKLSLRYCFDIFIQAN